MTLNRNLLLLSAASIAIAAGQSPDEPDWQTAAGGKMSFEVASVKPIKIPKVPNFDLSTGNAIAPGGRFSAGFPLVAYILFAYKLHPNDEQMRLAHQNVPKWVSEDFYEIEARAPGNPTKDQMRLMMQFLLEERFKLAVHFETKEQPVLALVLVKPDKIGPKLRPHSEGPPCPAFVPLAPGPPVFPKSGEIFPPVCNTDRSWFRSDGSALMGSRDSSMQFLADTVQGYGFMSGELDKPVVDRTGLKGTFDYTIEWHGRLSGPRPPGAAELPPPDPLGTTFLQALRDQLGLKLTPSRAPIRTIVIDHVERPSEN